MKHFLFSTHDLASFEECVENNQFWGTLNNKDAFKDLDITKGDSVIFYCAELKSFIAECEVLEKPASVFNYPDLKNWQKENWLVPLVVRLKKIKGINFELNDSNWKFLTTFNHLKDRKSVSGSLQSKPRREIDSLDYKYII